MTSTTIRAGREGGGERGEGEDGGDFGGAEEEGGNVMQGERELFPVPGVLFLFSFPVSINFPK